MSYMHISNLYQMQDILFFRQAYSMEKVHGSSAHVSWNVNEVEFFAGGTKHDNFVALFDRQVLADKMAAIGEPHFTVYGEAYGGKMQGMSKTYGPNLRFIAFEVQIGEVWLAVPQAEEVARKCGLDFVPYKLVSTDLAVLDAERDSDSEVAKRCGIVEPRHREGIVLRPLIEVRKNNGVRIIAKHKRAEFSERVSVPEVDPQKRVVLEQAEAIATEWVTAQRLGHVLDALGNPREMSATGKVIAAMIEDVEREAAGEIVTSKDARRAIGCRAAKLYKALVSEVVVKEQEVCRTQEQAS
jgi:hypothetical protein